MKDWSLLIVALAAGMMLILRRAHLVQGSAEFGVGVAYDVLVVVMIFLIWRIAWTRRKPQ